MLRECENCLELHWWLPGISGRPKIAKVNIETRARVFVPHFLWLIVDNQIKFDLEQKFYENKQYSKRECLEKWGVPRKKTLLKLFSEVNTSADPSNVQDPRHLKTAKNDPQKAIV